MKSHLSCNGFLYPNHIQFLTAVSILFPLFIHSYFRFVKNTEMFPVYFDQPVFLHLSKLI